MKKTIYIISCSMIFLLNAYSGENSSFMDSLTIERSEIKVKYISQSFLEGQEASRAQTNRSKIADNSQVVISPESQQKIDNDGGLLQVLKNSLSPENFDKLSRRIKFSVGVVMNQDCEILYGNSIAITNGNMENITLSETEVKKLFDYAKDLRFTYVTKPEGNFLYLFYYSSIAIKE